MIEGQGSQSSEKTDAHAPIFDHRLTLRRATFEVSSLCGVDDAQFELRFMEDVVERDPCNEDALMLLGHVYTQKGDYEKGLDVDRRLARLRPGDATAHYNLACSCSLVRKLDDAFVALERAATLGYRDVEHILKDPDLENLRGDARFRRFASRIFGKSGRDS